MAPESRLNSEFKIAGGGRRWQRVSPGGGVCHRRLMPNANGVVRVRTSAHRAPGCCSCSNPLQRTEGNIIHR
eukprot:scaffold74704_cov30-Tisochrysis_lutea.AAC.1